MRPVPVSIREPLRHVLLERQESRLPWETARPASVLIPLVERAGEVHVWLIRRPETMQHHSGQVAFPGGKRDPDDRTSMVTALREVTGNVAARVSVLQRARLADAAKGTRQFIKFVDN